MREKGLEPLDPVWLKKLLHAISWLWPRAAVTKAPCVLNVAKPREDRSSLIRLISCDSNPWLPLQSHPTGRGVAVAGSEVAVGGRGVLLGGMAVRVGATRVGVGLAANVTEAASGLVGVLVCVRVGVGVAGGMVLVAGSCPGIWVMVGVWVTVGVRVVSIPEGASVAADSACSDAGVGVVVLGSGVAVIAGVVSVPAALSLSASSDCPACSGSPA